MARYGPRYRIDVTVVALLGTVSAVLTTTTVNVALPDIMGSFGIGQGRAQSLSTGALAGMTIGQLVSAWLIDSFGQRKGRDSDVVLGCFRWRPAARAPADPDRPDALRRVRVLDERRRCEHILLGHGDLRGDEPRRPVADQPDPERQRAALAAIGAVAPGGGQDRLFPAPVTNSLAFAARFKKEAGKVDLGTRDSHGKRRAIGVLRGGRCEEERA